MCLRRIADQDVPALAKDAIQLVRYADLEHGGQKLAKRLFGDQLLAVPTPLAAGRPTRIRVHDNSIVDEFYTASQSGS